MTGHLPFPEPAASGAASPKKRTSKRVFLLDGTALAYRGHFALIKRPLTTSTGQNVSALYVFATTLLRILDAESPDYLAVAFDPRGKTFRHEQYKEYKATRDKTPPEMVDLLPAIRELVDGFNTPILEIPGYEADDVIATVAIQAAEAGHEVFIVTGDKDFLQIVSPRIRLYNILRTEGQVEIQGEKASEEKFGVAPRQVVDVLALMGDSSDNVPGVAGVGKKTASELVAEYGSVEGIYEHIEDISKPALKRKLEDGRDAAFLSKQLVTLDLEAPVEFDDAAFRYDGPDADKLTTLFREYEMNSLLQRLSIDASSGDHDYQLLTTADALREFMAGADSFALDLVAGEGRHGALLGVALSKSPGVARYVPLTGSEVATELTEVLRPMLEDRAIHKTVHDVKSARAVLRRAEIEPRGFDFDVMLASYCVSPGEYQHDLSSLALRYLNYRKQPREEVTGKGRAKRGLAEIEPAEITLFVCERADLVRRLAEPLRADLAERGVDALMRDVEMPLTEVLEDMERVGIAVDLKVLKALSDEYTSIIEELTERIFELAGTRDLNINSPKQLGVVLFEKLEIHKPAGAKKKPRRTKTGYSTDAAVLESFRDHPLVAALLRYRMLAKLKSTYIDNLPALVDPADHRIHTSFNQTVAATGRLSSSDPNLQNIPIRTEEGRKVRQAFVPGIEDAVLLSADYSQVELRIMAHLSDDENLKKAFEQGVDVHRWTAGLIFGMPPDEVPAELRGRAKTINFGVMYGMGPHRLANETGMSSKEATEFIEAYFKTFAGVKRFLDETLEQARAAGYVTTMMGRRRAIADLDSPHSRVAAAARNMAINTPIQGTAADLIKVAMIRMQERLKQEKRRATMLLQVHDELLLEVPKDELAEVRPMVTEVMAGAIELSVPLVVEVGTGSNWLEAH